MNFKKIISTMAASALAVSAFAVSAGAALVVPDKTNDANHTEAGTGQVLIRFFESGNFDPTCDFGAIDSITVRVTPAASDIDLMDGNFGGAISTSCGPSSACPEDHGWKQSEFWGLNDEDLGFTADDSKPIQFNKVGDYLYEGTLQIDSSNCYYSEVVDAEGGYAQVCVACWGSDIADYEILSITCKDKSGNVLLAMDGAGFITAGGAAAAPAAVDAAPAAPAAGDVAAATDSSKGSPDTGVADVAVVAGLAVVAAGALVVSKKRK